LRERAVPVYQVQSVEESAELSYGQSRALLFTTLVE
jgi:hypothetical protein